MLRPMTAGMSGFNTRRRPNREFTHGELRRASDTDENRIIKNISSLESAALQETKLNAYRSLLSDNQRASFLVAWLKETGNQSFAHGQYGEAISQYEDAIRAVVEDRYELLSQNHINQGYIDAIKSNEAKFLMLDLVCCCNNTAQSYLKLGEFERATVRLRPSDVLN